MWFPIKAPLRIRRVKDDFILRDPRNESVHRLNSVAALVWQLCDGRRDQATIASEVAATFGKSASDVAGDVDGILERFTDEGLVYSAAGRREADVLLHCVQRAIGNGADDRVIRQDWNELDWHYIEQVAFQHGVFPLLYRGLCNIGQARVPIDVMQRFERQFRIIRERNEFLLQELLELIDALARNGIPAVPFKGPALAMQTYGDIGLRQFGDLDVLIPGDCAARAQDVLRARGCRLQVHSQVNVDAEYRGSHEIVHIDLQWAFARKLRFPVDFKQLWANVQRVDMGTAKVLQPPLADQALMLCAHGAKHCWSRLVWISDLAAFINRHRDDLDWQHIMDEARRLGAVRIVGGGARLACELLGSRIPAPVVAATQNDPKIAAIATELRLRIFAADSGPLDFTGSYGVWEGSLLYLRMRERFRDKLPFIWHLLAVRPVKRARALVTPNRHDRAVVALPRYAGFLYYLVRPVRLTVRYWLDTRTRVRF